MLSKLKNKNFLWNLIASISYALIQWIMLIFIVRNGPPIQAGYYTVALAITAPLALAFNLQLRTAQVTDQSNKYAFNEYLQLRYKSNVILIFVFLLLSLFYEGILFMTIVLVGSTKIIENTSEVIYGYYHKKGDLVFPSKSKLLKILFSTISFIGIFYLTDEFLLSLLIYLLIYILSFFIIDYPKIKRALKEDVTSQPLSDRKKLLYWTLPLGITSMIVSLNTNLSKIILEKFEGSESIGYYATLAYILYAGSILITSIGQIYSPQLSKFWQSHDLKSFVMKLKQMLTISIILGLILIIFSYSFGEVVLSVFYGKEYALYSNIFFILSIGSAFLFFSTYISYAITATGSFRQQPIVMTFILITNFIVSIFLIESFGISGAAYANIIVSVITCLAQTSILWKIIRKSKELN